MIGFKSTISAIAVHPKKPILAIAGAEGFIILWDYIKKGDPTSYQFVEYSRNTNLVTDAKGGKKDDSDNKIFTVIEFTPDGNELLVACRDGKIHVVDPVTGKFIKLTQPLKVSYEKSPSVKHLVVSEDG